VINWPVEQPTLVSEYELGRITLRPLREEDINSIYQACQDQTISSFTRVPYPYDREMAEEFVRGCDISYRNHQGIVFAIEVDGTFAGTIGLHGINLTDHCAEIGYWVEQSHRGKGLCTSALRSLIEFSLSVMEFRRLEAMADYNNLASQRVMERAGMVRDALLRNRVTKPNGNQIDMVLFSIVSN
jgi:RimJ/RimL family protein N-acetyltransferase